MSKAKARITHSYALSEEEDKKFMHYAAKKYGAKTGTLQKAVHEAIMDWIKKIEREK